MAMGNVRLSRIQGEGYHWRSRGPDDQVPNDMEK